MYAGPGVQVVDGLGGNDLICAPNGAHTLIGGPGNDVVIGGSADDALVGGPGNDLLDGAGGTDTIDYSSARRAIAANLGTGSATGEGTDTLVNDENLTGSPQSDHLTGDGSANTLVGGDGNNTLSGVGGDDVILGGDRRDVLDGGSGADTISGAGGGDEITGGPEDSPDGPDVISGGASVDEISGGGGDDTLSGDAGDDTLYGESGSDSLDGGAGFDIAYGDKSIRNPSGSAPGSQTCSNDEPPFFQCPDSTVPGTDTAAAQFLTAGPDGLGCNAYADPTADDGNPGTAAEPFRTVEHLVNSLKAGQTGCLAGGKTFTEPDFEIDARSVGAPENPIVLETTPGSASAAIVKGRIWVENLAANLVFRNLSLDGQNPLNQLQCPPVCQGLPSPTIDGDSITFTQDDVTTSSTSTCFTVGDVHQYGIAVNTQITRNRIHDCGGSFAEDRRFSGVDLEASRSALVENNWIYRSTDPGVDLIDDAQNTTVDHNVITTNGRGISFDGAIAQPDWNPAFYTPGGKYFPDGSSVTANVISDSTLPDPNPDTYQVMGTNEWGGDCALPPPDNPPYCPPRAMANAVGGNCFFEPTPPGQNRNIQPIPINFTDTGNTTASAGAGFVNAAADDYRLTGAEGTCATTFGPQILPGPDLVATASNAFSFAKLKTNKKKGSATLTVVVPGPGSLKLSGRGLVPQRVGGGAISSKAVDAAGAVPLLVKAKGKKKRKLNRTGRVKVVVVVTFTPTGGTPASQTRIVKLRKKLG
jgi:RTX calcium-binding nonapeptide repeat (4 copies)/Right handed beta helix region